MKNFNQFQEQCKDTLLKTPLPSKKDEDWKYSDTDKFLYSYFFREESIANCLTLTPYPKTVLQGVKILTGESQTALLSSILK